MGRGDIKTSRKIIPILLITAILLIGVPFLVEGKTENDKHYTLSLVATRHYSNVTLTAHLTSNVDHRERNVAGAVIHFYTCNSRGENQKEIGHSLTDRDGRATWVWIATKNGNYWFVASYTINEEH